MLQLRTIFILQLISHITLCQQHDGEHKFYISMPAHRLELMKIDQELIKNLDQYADKLQERIELLQRISDEISQPLREAKDKEEEYLGNPLNSFSLIRHMHSDWQILDKLMRNQVGQEQIEFLKKKLVELPLSKDIKEATEAIYRIEHAYKAQPKDMAKGLVDGIQYNANFSASDCYIIAMHHYRLGSYKKAIKWLMVASQLISSSDIWINKVFDLTLDDINLLLARCHLEMGNLKQAKKLLHNDKDKIANLNLALSSNIDNKQEDNVYLYDLLPNIYNKLCRSSFKPKPSRLQCRYNTTTTPFLHLAPFRMEQLSLNPYIVAYHNVLSDMEISELIQFTTPLFEKAVIHSPALRNGEKYRTVDGVWIPDDEHPTSIRITKLINRIMERMFDLTGLKLNSIDSFQVLRYGFGGHYTPHYDFFNSSFWYTAINGERIATVLFYLSDVTHGGATVFPWINLKILAEKGKAIFWYNLDGDSHDYDEDTWHGACPVIDGIKLAMTSWINEWNQMFTKPIYRPGNRVVL